MSSIIVKPLNGEACIAADDFTVVELDQTIPSTGKVLVNIAVWQAQKDALKARAQAGELGVWLSPDDNPELLAHDVSLLPVVAFHFPVFKFGQGYSGAVLLRSRYGFQGDIRAYGDIWRDQLFYLARCGFTQFDIKDGKSLEDALLGFKDFTVPYQTSADGALPIFTRRAA
ncbi:DUF934 domain-containing protein [Limnobacter humi]|uniref:DUF934 domain-containing protein n=1 Tax=Limnobacter humi TaxID=1778671 RepID=A0ABT1WJJ3_9BURK|nr:DUF934 domain-containing protein [Limnobacter humi]MCQ8896917.1 DUF934 domain-containing protein [Limnobacter humi]